MLVGNTSRLLVRSGASQESTSGDTGRSDLAPG